MTRRFAFESRTQLDDAGKFHVELEIEICIECRDLDGADAEYTIESIGVVGAEPPVWLELDKLSAEDQLHLDRMAQGIADENACEAAQDYEIRRAEAAADAAQDR